MTEYIKYPNGEWFWIPNPGSPKWKNMDYEHLIKKALHPDNTQDIRSFDWSYRYYAEEARIIGKHVDKYCLEPSPLAGQKPCIWLFRFGPRGGWRRLWNFGNGEMR